VDACIGPERAKKVREQRGSNGSILQSIAEANEEKQKSNVMAVIQKHNEDSDQEH
jgi:hypothetical protein